MQFNPVYSSIFYSYQYFFKMKLFILPLPTGSGLSDTGFFRVSIKNMSP